MANKVGSILIIGTQRSGSNLLRIMMNQLKSIEAPHPPHILLTFSPLMNLYGDLSVESNFRLLIDDVARFVEANPVKWVHMEFDRDKIRSYCESNTLVQVFKAIYQVKAEMKGASFWCCKSMANLYFADAIEQEGLEPFYIHLVRDGRDVAASFKRAIVGEKHIYHLAKQWQNEQAIATSVISRYGKNRSAVLLYEQFIEDPEKSLSPVLEKIGLKWDNAMLNYFTSDEAKNTAAAGEMWKNVVRPVDNTNKQHYSEKLTPLDIEIFERIAGETLLQFGYETHYPLNAAPFTEEEVKAFDHENELLKNQARTLLVKDATARIPQEKVLSDIKSRRAGN
ncbi:MAG: sulfotransferase [Bacteroidetes bacterium]|nr:sulfotransferase [Bacteroidota bacterium]